MAPNTPNPGRQDSAQQAYHEASQQTVILLANLVEQVQHHRRDAQAGGVHWGQVGDLQHANELLLEVLNFLTGEPT